MSSRGLNLPDSTRERLEQFRQRVRLIKIAEGIMAGLFGLVLSYLAVFIIDRFIDTSALFRTSLLLSGSVGLAVLFPLKCHRWVWGTRSMEQVARLLKHRFPALGDQLLGIVELAHSDKDLGSSTRLAQAAIDLGEDARRPGRVGDSCIGDRASSRLQRDVSLADALAERRSLHVCSGGWTPE
jgi:hypothetical protein